MDHDRDGRDQDQPGPTPLRILLVEPDEVVGDAFAGSVQSRACDVFVVRTGWEAIDRITEDGHVDVVALDLHLLTPDVLVTLTSLRSHATAPFALLFVDRYGSRTRFAKYGPVLGVPFTPAEARAVVAEASLEARVREQRRSLNATPQLAPPKHSIDGELDRFLMAIGRSIAGAIRHGRERRTAHVAEEHDRSATG